MGNGNKTIGDSIEDLWEKYSVIISILFGIITGVCYYFGLIEKIRTTIGNVITFASIVIGVNGVFLTLLITLQESPAFERLRNFFPTFQTKLYISLRTQISYGLVVVTLSIIISILPPSPSILLSSVNNDLKFPNFNEMKFPIMNG
jgi:hypothetical protein